MSIKILLVDDHAILRTGLAEVLNKQANLEIVAQACNGMEAIKMASTYKPDVIIMDITMPELNGMEATAQILKVDPDIKVIALSMHSQKHYIRNMIEAGAAGYLLKDSDLSELLQAIYSVLKGNIYLQPDLAGGLVKDYLTGKKNRKSDAFIVLSAREREILQLLAEGHSAKKIAGKLNLSIRTIENHRRNIMEKLDIHTVVELTRYAIREGITSV